MTPAAAKALAEAKGILTGEIPPPTQPEREPMRWRQVNDYHAISDAGYRISRSWSRGEIAYSAWTPDSRNGSGLLGVYRGESANQQAAECCNQHRQGRTE